MSAVHSVFITGANRGIGFGLVRELLKNEDIKHVIAGTRNLETSTALKDIKDNRLKVVPIDVKNDESIAKAVAEVDKIVGAEGLNLLVNNAAIYSPYFFDSKPDRKPLRDSFEVNVISVTIVTQHFLPLLEKAAKHNSNLPLSSQRAAVANISAALGSFEINTRGSRPWGSLAYSMSKTALNMLSSSMRYDLKDEGIMFASIHPGWVKTDMGGEQGDLELEESTGPISKLLLSLNEEHNGRLWRYDGSPMPF